MVSPPIISLVLTMTDFDVAPAVRQYLGLYLALTAGFHTLFLVFPKLEINPGQMQLAGLESGTVKNLRKRNVNLDSC